jgi:DNA-binding MarR family transcriptional regulator
MPMLAHNKFKPSFTEDEKAHLRALVLALKPFIKAKPTIPLSYVLTALTVALDENEGVAEYAKALNMSPTVMTRHLLDLGERNRLKEPGLGWITSERDLFDLRKHRARFTSTGAAMLRDVVHALKLAPKPKDT